MDAIHLPLLPGDTKLTTVWTAMRWLQKSAVIRKSNDLRMISAGAVVHALAKQLNSFSSVRSKSEVREVTPRDVARWQLDVVDPRQTKSSYERYLDYHGTHYAMIDTVPGIAWVVTRQESEAKAADQAPGACYCIGDSEHSHTAPPTKDYDICWCQKEIFCWPPVQ